MRLNEGYSMKRIQDEKCTQAKEVNNNSLSFTDGAEVKIILSVRVEE